MSADYPQDDEQFGASRREDFEEDEDYEDEDEFDDEDDFEEAYASTSQFGDHDVRTQPADSKIECTNQGGVLTLTIPAAFLSGCVPLFMGLIGTVVLSSVAVLAYTQKPDGLLPALVIGGFAAVFFLLFLYGVSLGRRRGQVIVHSEKLFVTQSGLLFKKSHLWHKHQIKRVGALPTGVKVNDQPVLELAVITQDEQRFGVFAQLDGEELRWMATLIRDALDVASPQEAAASDPNARGTFTLTKFPEWQPGRRVHIVSIEMPVAALVVIGVFAAVVGGALGYFLLHEVLSAIANEWECLAAGVLLAVAVAMVFLTGAMPRREVLCDWSTRLLFVQIGRDTSEFSFGDIQSLCLWTLTRQQRKGSDKRSYTVTEYLAELDLRTRDGQDVLLLTTEDWGSAPGDSLRELTPLAETLADALDVRLEKPGQKEQDALKGIWHHAAGWSKFLLVLVVAALVGVCISRVL